jgi:tetratricopeptide (TPR) repeat protein
MLGALSRNSIEHLDDYDLRYLVSMFLKTGYVDRALLLVGDAHWSEVKFDRFGDDASTLDDLAEVFGSVSDRSEDTKITVAGLGAVKQLLFWRSSDLDDDELEYLVFAKRDEKATAAANRRTDPALQIDGLLTVFEATRDAGRPYLEALLTADKVSRAVPLELGQTRRLLRLARDLRDAKQTDRAGQLLKSVSAFLSSLDGAEYHFTPTNRAYITIGIQGREPPAPALLRRVSDVHIRDRLLLDAQELLWTNGDLSQLEWLNALSSPELRVMALQRLARAKTAANEIEEIEKLAEQALEEIAEIDEIVTLAISVARVVSFATVEPSMIDALKGSVQIIINKAEELAKAPEEFFWVQYSRPLTAVNIIILIENLCEIAKTIGTACVEPLGRNILKEADRLAHLLPVEELQVFGENPVVYVEELVEEEVVSSVAYFESRDDALSLVSTSFATIGDWSSAMKIFNEIANSRSRRRAWFDLVQLRARRGDLDQVLELIGAVEPSPLQLSFDGPSFIWITPYNNQVYCPSETDTFSFVATLLLSILAAKSEYTDINKYIERVMAAFDAIDVKLPTGVPMIDQHPGNLRSGIPRLKLEARILLAVAREVARRGCLREATAYFKRAERLRDQTREQANVGEAERSVIRALLSAGAVDPARRLIALVNNPLFEMESLSRVTELEAGKAAVVNVRARMREIVATMSEENTPSWIVIQFAAIDYLARSGDSSGVEWLPELTRRIDLIKDPRSRSLLTMKMAEVVDSLQETLSERMRVEVTDEIFSRALYDARKIVPRWESIPVLIELAEAMIRRSRHNQAEKIYDLACSEVRLRFADKAHAGYITRLSQSMADAGNYEKAVALASTLVYDPRYKRELNDTLIMLIERLVRRGRVYDAVMLQLCHTDVAASIASLCRMTAALKQVGSHDLALAAFEHAEALASGLDVGNRDEARLDLVIAAVCLEYLEGAADYASAILAPSLRNAAQNVIATKWARAGQWGAAVALVQTASSTEYFREIVSWFDQDDILSERFTRRVLGCITEKFGWRYDVWRVRNRALVYPGRNV